MSLTPDNEKKIKEFLLSHPNALLLREWHKWQEIRIGDVLIRQKRMGWGAHVSWRHDLVSASCHIPKKFKVVHIDELDVPWLKQVSVRGGLGNRIISLADTVDSYRYEQDPEMAMAVLLGVEYAPRAQYKRWRDGNPD